MADGSITFSTALDNAQLEKDLAALTKKIENTEQELARLRAKHAAGREKGVLDGAVLDAEKAKLQEIKDRLADIRAMSRDKTLAPEARENAKALIPSVQEELSNQQTRVNALQTEWNKTENAVDRYAQRLAGGEAELERQKEAAGALQQQLNEAVQARQAAQSSAAVADQHIVGLNRELLELKERQAALERTGVGLGYQEYDQVLVRISAVNRELNAYRSGLAGAASGAEEAGASAGVLSEAMRRAGAYADRFLNRVRRLASRVFVFTVITSALRAVRTWMSNTVKTSGEVTAALARVKGAFLTLAQPLVEAVIPALAVLLNVLARVIAAAAQLASLLFGKTLKQSSDGAKALSAEAQALEGVGSAAEDAAGSLAGFDEINAIQTGDGGGSGGSGAASEIAPDFGWMEGDGLLDKLKETADLVGLIAAGFALWRIGSLLPGILGTVFTTLGLILMTLGGVLLCWNGLTDAWENGVDWANLLEMLGGLAAAAFGLYQLLGPTAAGIALIAGGLGMLAAGFHDALEHGWNLQNLLLSIAGLLAAGLGIALITGSWIPLLIAGIAAVLLAVTTATGHGEELLNGVRTLLKGFIDFFQGVFTGDFDLAVQGLKTIFEGLGTVVGSVLAGVRDFCSLFLDWLDEKTNGRFHGVIETVRTMVSGLVDGAEQLFSGLTAFLSGVFSGDLSAAIDGIEAILGGLETAAAAILDGIQSLWLGLLDWLDEKTNGQFSGIIETARSFVTGFFTTVKETLAGMMDAVTELLTGVLQFITGVFTGDWELAWEGVKNIFKGVWNEIVSLLEGAVNFIIRGVNSFLSGLNKLKLPDWMGGGGVHIPSIPEVKIPRLAQGAVIPPNREFMAVLGDQRAGNNLEAPEALLRRIVREESGGGGETAALLQAILEAVQAGHVIMVDRRVLGQTVTQEQNRMTRQSGRPVVLG